MCCWPLIYKQSLNIIKIKFWIKMWQSVRTKVLTDIFRKKQFYFNPQWNNLITTAKRSRLKFRHVIYKKNIKEEFFQMKHHFIKIKYIDCMFLSCHVRISEWIHFTVTWMSRSSLLEAGGNLKFKWLQRDSNPQPLSS